MTSNTMKMANPLARLHLGCGESLARLLPDVTMPSPATPRDTIRPVAPAGRTRRKK